MPEQTVCIKRNLLTNILISDDQIIYIVETSDRLYQESLLHIGFVHAV